MFANSLAETAGFSVLEIVGPLVNVAYVIAAVLFILGLKKMAHPRTAVRGNLLGVLGMALAVSAAVVHAYLHRSHALWFVFIAIGVPIGAGIGVYLARTTKLTAMPQLVALFNGFGGVASLVVAGADMLQRSLLSKGTSWDVLLATGLSGLIGTVTFWGSLVAWGKLKELDLFKKPIGVPDQLRHVINAGLGLVLLIMIILLCLFGHYMLVAVLLYFVIFLIATFLAYLLVSPIGGADMPVVIALLNSYSGLAAAATGFVIDNNVLIISGSLVGASGIILTRLMCKAMNRSLVNVLFGGMGTSVATDTDEIYATVRSTTADDVALILDSAQRVVFVPGYGMAVAQAQHAVRDLSNLLEKNGTTVEYAIHPVAGRMPGHMNVLLAEADVDYEKLKEMDHINPTMETVDVAIVIGANDTVNPVSRTDPNSPIAGMPIIDVDKARTVVVIKRSLSPGFAGIPNPLFANENTLMLFGDGQQAILDVIAALKEA